MRIIIFILSLMVALLSWSATYAVEPEEQLNDPALETRARAISANLRCLVCQNQSIDDSDASLAKDLRLIVRQHLQKGASDQEVIDYLVARYGEFVLLKPRWSAKTYLLWLAPAVLVVAGLGLAAGVLRKPAKLREAKPLSDEEKRALSAILNEPGSIER